jgi:Protein of unknown function (DUF3095)
MSENIQTDSFYAGVPVFHDFTSVTDPALYRPLPGDWMVGVADVEQSTKAIREHRYKAVNMAGAAVIVAVTNALNGRDFPFVFGGDGAGFAVPASDAGLARDALAATAAWVKEELDLTLRVALLPVSAVRAHGADVRVARFAASQNISIAMFSGGGMAWADTAMKQGRFALPPSPPGVRPDLNGLSCRYEELPNSRGLILSLVLVKTADASPDAFRAVVEDVVRLVDKTPGASRPVTSRDLHINWPSQGYDLEARAQRRAGEWLGTRKAKVLARTFLYFLIMRFGITVGRFSPRKYSQQVVENSDFRKYDDALRMVLDCTPELAGKIEHCLAEAVAKGTVRFGLHRQDAAMMTCFTPSPISANHVHFIDGAHGGYAAAASALKISAI